MPDAATTTADTTTTTTTTAPATPWYQGKLDADLIGHMQNKGWKSDDPIAAFTDAAKAHRDAEKFVGVPADQLLRLPKDAKDEAGWNTVYTRLGKPKEAKDYDLSGVKFADGAAIDDSFADMIRQTSFSQHIPKDAATAFAQSVVKFMEGKDQSEAAELKVKLDGQKSNLQKSWGTNFDFNKLTAMQGAKRLGVSEADVSAMEGVVGYDRIMEMFRKVGAGTNEDTFVEGGKGADNPKTVESAKSRLDELQADTAWRDRFLKGGVQERREFDTLTTLIAAAA
jgi:hypothetical protein